MARAYYEIWITDHEYKEDVKQVFFKSVEVQKELNTIPKFAFTLDRNFQSELSAPAVGDKIRIYRNNEEFIVGKISNMEAEDYALNYEGFSIAGEWRAVLNGDYDWSGSTTYHAIKRYAEAIGWTPGVVEVFPIEDHVYDYKPLIEELEYFASTYGMELRFNEKDRKVDFTDYVGSERGNEIRFARGVNLDSITVKEDEDEAWETVIALGAGEGENQLKVVVGDTENKYAKVEVFTDKEIKTKAELTSFANAKLKEGKKGNAITYEATVISPISIAGLEMGDRVWLEDSKNHYDGTMRVLAVNASFDGREEQFDIVLANKAKSLIQFLHRLEKGQRTLANVHHTSAVQPGRMIKVDPKTKNPVLLEVENDNFVNATSGNSIGVIESNVNSAQSVASSAQTDATNALTTAGTANETANSALGKAESVEGTANTALGKAEDALDQAGLALTEAQKKQDAMIISPDAPTSPAVDMIWIDTSNPRLYVHKVWTGSEWRKATPTEAEEIGAESLMPKTSSAPSNPVPDQFWLDTSRNPNVLMRWDSGLNQWVKATPTSASEVGAYDTATTDNKIGEVNTKADEAKETAGTALTTAGTAQQTATTAKNTADTAKATADSADTKATDAQNRTANTTKEVNGTYFLDGGKILTGSVGADALKANEITAEKLNIGLGIQQVTSGDDVLSLHTSATFTGATKKSGADPDYELLQTANQNPSSMNYLNYYSFGTGTQEEVAPEKNFMQVDLGLIKDVGALRLWFYSRDNRSFYYKVKVSQDGVNWFYLVGDAERYVESNPGRVLNYPTLVTFPAVKIRYIRIYGNGSTATNTNLLHWVNIYNKVPVGSVQSSDGTVVINDSGIQVKPNADAPATTIIDREGVNILDGNFSLQGRDGVWFNANDNSIQSFKNHLLAIQNMIGDHSFEMQKTRGNVLSHGHFLMEKNTQSAIGKWRHVGEPLLLSSVQHDLGIPAVPFANQMVTVDNYNYVEQEVLIHGGLTYTLSFHVVTPFNVEAGSPRVKLTFLGDGLQVGETITYGFSTPDTEYNHYVRHAITFTAPYELTHNAYSSVLIKLTCGSVTGYASYDGIQLVHSDKPVTYEAESSFWAMRRGMDKYPVVDSLSTIPIRVPTLEFSNGLGLSPQSETGIYAIENGTNNPANMWVKNIYLNHGFDGPGAKVNATQGNAVSYYDMNGQIDGWYIMQRLNVVLVINGTNGYSDFNFHKPFRMTPYIVGTAYDSNSSAYNVAIYNITRTGCRVYASHIHNQSFSNLQIKVQLLILGY